MKNFIKALYKNHIFSLVIWLVIIFLAIISLPNINEMASRSGNPLMSSHVQTKKGQNVETTWAQHVPNHQFVNVVYHAKKGRINHNQQNDIYSKVADVQKHKNAFGIQNIITAHNSPNGQSKFISGNGSTEIIQLQVSKQTAGDPGFAADIQSQFQTGNGLENYVTSPSLLNYSNTAIILHITNVISIAAFILALLFIGIVFRSLLAPLLSFITLYVAYLVSLSGTAFLTNKYGMPYSTYTPLIVLLSVLFFGTLSIFFLYRRFELALAKDEDNEREATKLAVRKAGYPIMGSAVGLSIAFACFYLFRFNPISAFGSISVPLLVTALAILTINPLFMELLGKTIFWPKKKVTKLFGNSLWDKLTRFGQWGPGFAIFLVLACSLPFVVLYRNNVSYLDNNNVTQYGQAEVGARVLQANFNPTKPTPVNIYVSGNSKLRFDNENTLNPIDQVTNKLQSMKNVARVYSVTQPGGEPINKYYLTSQLTNTNNTLKGIAKTMGAAQSKLKSGENQINPGNFDTQVQSLNNLQNQINSMQSNTAGGLPVQSAESIKAKKMSKSARASLNSLNRELEEKNADLSNLNNQINTASGIANITTSNLQGYSTKLRRAKSDMVEVQNALKVVQKKLNSTTKFISGIQGSVAGKTYYASPADINDTDFFQTMSNFNNPDNTTTLIQVEFKQIPDGKVNSENMHHLQQEVNTVLQGTRLNGQNVTYTGVPVENDFLRSQFKLYFAIGLGILFSVLFLTLIIISRSILHPFWWLITFVLSSLVGLQATSLIMSYAAHEPKIDWTTMNLMLIPLAIIGTIELVSLAVSYRKQNPDILGWLHTGIKSFGNGVLFVLLATVLISLSLLFGNFYQFDYLRLMTIITIIVFNITLPIVSSALGKLSIKLPLQKLYHPHWFRRKEKQ